MGNRILKDSIRTSMEIDALNWFEEVMFYRLIVSVDDYGVYPADPVLLAHLLFPRKESISRKAIESALDHLEQLHLIYRYHDSKQCAFLHLTTWDKHQRLRTTHRKYPGPEDACDPGIVVSKEEKDLNVLAVTADNAEKQDPAASESEKRETTTEPAVITIPLNDGTEFPVLQKDADEFASLYPAVNIMQELRSMRGWCLNNETKRKTRTGIRRFINNWMAQAQNRGGTALIRSAAGPAASDNPYRMMICEGAVE